MYIIKREKMLWYLSTDIFCCENRKGFLEENRERVFATRGIFFKFGSIAPMILNFSCGIFIHVSRFEKLQASENIWWVIREITE